MDNDKIILELLNFTKQILSGNYEHNSDSSLFTGTYKELYSSICAIRNKMRHDMFEIQVASSQVTSATDEITLAIDESNVLTEQLHNEASQIQQLNIKSQASILDAMQEIKQITNLFSEVKTTSDRVKDKSKLSQEVLEESMKEIFEIVGSVESIKQSTDNTVEYIGQLNQSTNEIKDILETVSSIARQTQIISLNAAIESARAGSAGRGFSVLTEEIRSLAEQSKNAVEQIGNIMHNISDEMNHLQEQMTQEQEDVKKSVDCSKKVENGLVRIEETYSDVQDMMQSIIFAVQKENKLSQQIDDRILEVEDISRNVSNGFDQIYASVVQQKNNTDEIGQLGYCLSNAANALSILNNKADINLIEENEEKFSNTAANTIKIIDEDILSFSNFPNLQFEDHKIILDEIMSKHKFIEAIWTNNRKGKFIYSNPPAGIANARMREWFKASLDNKQYTSDLYISAITKNPCKTVSLPILDSNNEVVGVIGADLKLRI